MPKSLQPFIWKQAPFVRIVPAFASGIVVQHLLPFPLKAIIIFISVIIGFLIYFSFENFIQRFFHAPLRGILFLLLLFFSGMLTCYNGNIQNKDTWYGHHLKNAEALEGTVISPPEEKEKTFKTTVQITKVIRRDSVLPAEGKLLVYVSKNNLGKMLQKGDTLLFKNKIQEISDPKNPGSFDYRGYLANKNIFHQAILMPGEFTVLGNTVSKTDILVQKSLGYENKLFSKYISSTGPQALMKALLTGDRKDIEREVVQAYTNTGIVHILSISGLHIGLIYVFLFQLSRLIPGIRQKKTLRLLLVLPGIWFFAVLTGSGPSVLRSALMFTFLSIGMMQGRKAVTYNFWAASAFLILCFNPMLLWDIGFQLSYAAVLGILIWQRLIYNLLIFRNKILDYLWQLITVSLSAQILTLPISLYHFHQFPMLFLFANLVAVPLVAVGLWAGMLMLFLGWMSALGFVFGEFINLLFSLLDSFILYVDSIRYGLWTGFYPTVFEVVLLYLLIVLIHFWIRTRKISIFKYALGIALILISSFFYAKWMAYSQDRLVVYKVSGQPVIDYYNGFRFSKLDPSSQDAVAVKSGRSFFNVKYESPLKVFRTEIGDYFSGKRNFLWIKNKPQPDSTQKKIQMDAIIISNSPDINIKELSAIFESPVYIFSTNNKRALVQKWKKECEDLHLRSEDARDPAAVVIDY